MTPRLVDHRCPRCGAVSTTFPSTTVTHKCPTRKAGQSTYTTFVVDAQPSESKGAR